MDGVSAGEQLPDLGRKDAEVGAAVGGSLGTGMGHQNMQHAHPKPAVLALLAPYPGRSIHERSEGAVRSAERPDTGKFLGIDAGALAHQANRRRNIPRFLDSGLQSRPERIGLRIVMPPETPV